MYLRANQQLRVKLGAAANTTAPLVTTAAFQIDSGEEMRGMVVAKDVATNGTTEVVIVEPYDDGSQLVDSVIVSNLDAISHTVTISKFTTSTDWQAIGISVPAGDMLIIDRNGWNVVS